MRVVIADDEPLARERLRALLADTPGVEVVGRGRDGEAALHACAEHQPDLVLLDIAMPGIDGLEAARHLAERFDRARRWCSAPRTNATRCRAFEAGRDRLPDQAGARRAPGCRAGARAHLPPGVSVHRRPPAGPHWLLCARVRGSLRLIPIEDIHYLQAEEKYVVVHHARGEGLIEESLKSLEDEFTASASSASIATAWWPRHELLGLKTLSAGRVLARLLRYRHDPRGQPAQLPAVRQLLRADAG